MAHGEAEQGSSQGEKPWLVGDQEQTPPPAGPVGKPLRWACGSGPHLRDGVPVVPGIADESGGLVPQQRAGEPEDREEPEHRSSPTCQPDGPGWAGAHRHGAVRPRRRTNRRERPPRRWC